MLCKELLLIGKSVARNSTEIVITNGYRFVNTDPELPNWGIKQYGYIEGEIGEVSPSAPVFRGLILTGLYYDDNMDMGGRALVEFDSSALPEGELPDELTRLKLSNVSRKEEYEIKLLWNTNGLARYGAGFDIESVSPEGEPYNWVFSLLQTFSQRIYFEAGVLSSDPIPNSAVDVRVETSDSVIFEGTVVTDENSIATIELPVEYLGQEIYVRADHGSLTNNPWYKDRPLLTSETDYITVYINDK